MNAICERFNRALREQFNEILLFEDLALFNLKLAEYLALYNSKRLHKALALMTPVEYILKENKNCNMWGPHTQQTHRPPRLGRSDQETAAQGDSLCWILLTNSPLTKK